jgi:hypothetical protein
MFTCEQPVIVNLSGYEPTMPKAKPKSGARQRPGRRSIQPPSGIDGQIAELCRDLAVEAKRMRQLQEQADELQMVIRQWISDAEPDDPEREPVSRAGRR